MSNLKSCNINNNSTEVKLTIHNFLCNIFKTKHFEQCNESYCETRYLLKYVDSTASVSK